MTASWPTTVNLHALMSSYSEKIDPNFREWKPEIGRPKRRRRFSASSDTVTFSTWMTLTEYQAFLAFYRTTLLDGTLPFTRPRPRTGAIETWLFVGKNAPTPKAVNGRLYEVALSMVSVPSISAPPSGLQIFTLGKSTLGGTDVLG